MTAIDMMYDSDVDKVVFAAEVYEGDFEAVVSVAIPREEFLQRLLEISSEFGDAFDVFEGRFAGEEESEPTELTFLQPPTLDCIGEDEE